MAKPGNLFYLLVIILTIKTTVWASVVTPMVSPPSEFMLRKFPPHLHKDVSREVLLDVLNSEDYFTASNPSSASFYFHSFKCTTSQDVVSKYFDQRIIQNGRTSSYDIGEMIRLFKILYDLYKRKDVKRAYRLGRKYMLEKVISDIQISEKENAFQKKGFFLGLVTTKDEIRVLRDRNEGSPPKIYKVNSYNALFALGLSGTFQFNLNLGLHRSFTYMYDASNLTAKVKLHETSPNDCVDGVAENICISHPVIDPCGRNENNDSDPDDDWYCKTYGSNIHYHKRGYERTFNLQDLTKNIGAPRLKYSKTPITPEQYEAVLKNPKATMQIKVGINLNMPKEPANIKHTSIPLSTVLPNFVLVDEMLGDEPSGLKYNTTTDLTINLHYNGSVFQYPVNRYLIFARSEYLQKVIENATINETSQSVDLSLDISDVVFEQILYFIYFNKVEDLEKCKMILDPSWRLELFSLFEKCLKYVKAAMVQDTALEYLRLSVTQEIRPLKVVALEYLRNNAHSLSTSEFTALLNSLPTM